MRLQFQEGLDKHYWSKPIFGKYIFGTDPPEFYPVTKLQVQQMLGAMFNEIRNRSYKREKGWAPYNLGGDEPRLWQAIKRMSEYVQENGPTDPRPDPTWHQEYLYPDDHDRERIDLENVIGVNLRQ